ncbi:MAG: MFS transporter [Nitrospiraceae bacterium]|nr:MFS transporter [Nitrospiraceae bacterium]
MKKSVIASWCLYDFAGASYAAVITAVIFPVYYANHIVGNAAGLGDLWWGRAISLSMLIVAVTSPFMGGIADRSGTRKMFLVAYTLATVVCVSMFSFLKAGAVLEGFWLMVAANVAKEGGFVFYNSYLPDIVPWQFRGRVSAWGYGIGYVGAAASLLIALPLVKTGHLSWVWLSVSAFFLFFSLPAFFMLPSREPAAGQKRKSGFRYAVEGTKSALRALKWLWLENRDARGFLIAYLFYQDGVNTVIIFSSIFATVSLGFGPSGLVALYLIVQMTALLGALMMAGPTDAWGPKKVIMLTLVLWVAVAAAAVFVRQKGQFLVVASVAGLGLGSIQAASRALFSRFIPPGRESEYFGVYSMIGKTSAIAGPLIFGLISHLTGSERPAVAAVGALFILGLAFIAPLRQPGPPSSL